MMQQERMLQIFFSSFIAIRIYQSVLGQADLVAKEGTDAISKGTFDFKRYGLVIYRKE